MTLHDAMQPVLCDGNGPLLDIRGNPAALPELVAVREVCRRIAISAPGDR